MILDVGENQNINNYCKVFILKKKHYKYFYKRIKNINCSHLNGALNLVTFNQIFFVLRIDNNKIKIK